MASKVPTIHLSWNGKTACNVKGRHSTRMPAEFLQHPHQCKRCAKLAEKLKAKCPEAFGLTAEAASPVPKAVPLKDTSSAPTLQTYNPLQHAYDAFNVYLFKGQLPDCLITLRRTDKRVIAYYLPDAFVNKADGKTYTCEIAFNPLHLNRSDTDTLSTLLHEMIHLWRNLQPKPSRRGYHDKVWAAKMNELGLKPRNCDNPERETGHKVTHEIVEGAQFAHLAADLIKGGWRMSWAEPAFPSAEGGAAKPKAKKKPTRAKYTCPQCGQNAWAKHDASLKCGECDVDMELAE